ncbi:hypothetical protein AH332_06385 [Salmonella enterica subsp. salamae]|nr:hypothetical protein [Salmonella enterica subsp. salamae]
MKQRVISDGKLNYKDMAVSPNVHRVVVEMACKFYQYLNQEVWVQAYWPLQMQKKRRQPG